MKNKPLLSICIPTYNRAPFLRECLFHILSAMKDGVTSDDVIIIISDNASTDDTKEVVKSFQKKYTNIQYFCNKKNIGGDRNVIQVASYAKTPYIWFFSDDDVMISGALKKMLFVIKSHHPEAIICNLDLIDKDGHMLTHNVLRLKKDKLLKTKKQLFTFFEYAFFLPIDWYITCLTNTIVSKRLFEKNVGMVMNAFDSSSSNFLHSGLIYYNAQDFAIYIISKSIAKFRSGNRSFGPDESTKKKEYLLFLYTILKRHYHYIYQANNKNMSVRFKSLFFLKNISRDLRYTFVKLFGIDISQVLINLFEKK